MSNAAGSPPSHDIDQDLGSEVRKRREKRSNAATGASAAGIRAIGTQAVAFYFRAPVKAFFRTRVDYMAFARSINPHVQAQERWSLRMSTPGLLAHAVRVYGWSFIPNHVLPPMVANVGVGALLYTSYLQMLGFIYEPSSISAKRTFPPPASYHTFAAGSAAGAIQSIFATPLDALSVRFKTSEMLNGQFRSTWQYAYSKWREIGVRGMFAGWPLVLIKDALGYGAFFATYEYVKAQAYYNFVVQYHGHFSAHQQAPAMVLSDDNDHASKVIRPHYAVEPMFLLLAGVSASIVQQLIQHPFSLLQSVHYKSLDSIERQTRANPEQTASRHRWHSAYQQTYHQCYLRSRRLGGWRRWLYKGFLANTIRQIPGTSAGLVIFELTRRRYGLSDETVKIEKDGYQVFLA